MNWIYIVIGMIVLLNIIFFVIYMKSNDNNKTNTAIPNPAYVHSSASEEDAKTVAMKSAESYEEDYPTTYISAPEDKSLKEHLQQPHAHKGEDKEPKNFFVDETVVLGTLTADESTEKRIEYKQEDEVEAFAWDETQVIIVGRDPLEADLTLTKDLYVGRTHAIIYKKADAYYVVDLGSRNGTFIDGIALEGITKISLGQTFVLGKTEMTIV